MPSRQLTQDTAKFAKNLVASKQPKPSRLLGCFVSASRKNAHQCFQPLSYTAAGQMGASDYRPFVHVWRIKMIQGRFYHGGLANHWKAM